MSSFRHLDTQCLLSNGFPSISTEPPSAIRTITLLPLDRRSHPWKNSTRIHRAVTTESRLMRHTLLVSTPPPSPPTRASPRSPQRPAGSCRKATPPGGGGSSSPPCLGAALPRPPQRPLRPPPGPPPSLSHNTGKRAVRGPSAPCAARRRRRPQARLATHPPVEAPPPPPPRPASAPRDTEPHSAHPALTARLPPRAARSPVLTLPGPTSTRSFLSRL